MRISDWSSDVCSSDLPARPRDPAVVEGETQVRELLRRIEEFRARIPRPPEAASYEPSDAEDVLEQQPDVREHFSAAEEPIDDIPDSQWTAVPEVEAPHPEPQLTVQDRKSTRLNSSH